jgi:tetratricopeptide (TPR) repeat protein
MHCNSCGGAVDLGPGGAGRCGTCHRLFHAEGGELTELRVEPPAGAPRTEFLASFCANLGLPPMATPPRGMRGFEFLTMDDDATALATRAERTAEYGPRTFDMIRASYACPRCNRPTPAPVPLIPTRAPYRSLTEVQGALPGLLEAGARAGRQVPACSCGTAPVLAQADHHLFCSRTNADLVVRIATGQPPQLFGWTLPGGHQPMAPTPDLDRAVAADAILRTLGGLKDSFGDDEDFESFATVLDEGIARTPENRALLELCPFLLKHGGSAFVARLAAAHLQAAPQSELGYYWRAQLLIESASRGGGDPRATAEAASLLERAVQIRPDYPDALIGLANLARLARDDASAEARLRALLAAHPQHPEGNYTLGLVLLPRDPAGALACFERGEASAPNDPDYPRSRARALLALGRKAEARTAIQRAASLAPDDPRIAQLQAEIGSGGGGSMASSIRWIVIAFIVAVFVGVGIFVFTIVKSAAPAAAPPAPTSPPAAATPGPAPTAPAPSPTPKHPPTRPR